MSTSNDASGDSPGPVGRRERSRWRAAKVAVGERSDLAEMLARLERCTIAAPSLLLEACIHQFLLGGRDRQRDAVDLYLRSLAQPAGEALPIGEAEDVKLMLSQLYG